MEALQGLPSKGFNLKGRSQGQGECFEFACRTLLCGPRCENLGGPAHDSWLTQKTQPPFTINYKSSNIVQKPTLILGRCLLTRLSSVPTACSRPTAGGFRPAPLWFAIRFALPTLREVPPLYRCTSARQMMPAMLLQKTTGSLRSLYWADLREDKMINSGLGFWHIFGPSGPREPRERPWL